MVELSNPTNWKTARTKPRRSPPPVTPRSRNCSRVQMKAVAHQHQRHHDQDHEQGDRFVHSMSRAETFTSRQATHMAMPVTKIVRITAAKTV